MSFGQPDDRIRYGSYLCIPELLELQRPLTKEHDELQFIVVHQAYELWFRLILHELDEVLATLGKPCAPGREGDGNLWESTRLLARVTKIQDVLLAQLPVVETMRPGDFLRFRDHLKPASGFQSAQFREIEFVAGLKDRELLERCDADAKATARLQARMSGPTMWERFAAVARARGVDVKPGAAGSVEYQVSVAQLCRLYADPASDPALYALAEAYCDFDERLVLWRSRHISMVERVIGGKIGTGYAATGTGYEGVRYLATTLRKRAFPELWDVRTQLGEKP